MWQRLLGIAVAGALGALARYWLIKLIQPPYHDGFPWGTLAVNVTGCFLFGVVWSLAETKLLISAGMRTVILVGFMGSFTTFSTFAFETGRFLQNSQWLPAIGNIMAHNVIGVVFLFLGLAIGNFLI